MTCPLCPYPETIFDLSSSLPGGHPLPVLYHNWRPFLPDLSCPTTWRPFLTCTLSSTWTSYLKTIFDLSSLLPLTCPPNLKITFDLSSALPGNHLRPILSLLLVFALDSDGSPGHTHAQLVGSVGAGVKAYLHEKSGMYINVCVLELLLRNLCRCVVLCIFVIMCLCDYLILCVCVCVCVCV